MAQRVDGSMQEPAIIDTPTDNPTQNPTGAPSSSMQTRKRCPQQSSSDSSSSSLNSIRPHICQQLRRSWRLYRLWNSVLRSLVTTAVLFALLCLLTFIVAVVFYYVNRHGHTDSSRYLQLKTRQAEYQQTLNEVVAMARESHALMNSSLVIKKLHRLRQLGRNYAYKGIGNAIKLHELKPTFTQSLYYAVTLVSLIGYGDIAGASELQYFCACLSMLIVVPVWFMYHHQLYQLFYLLQFYCHRRWFQKPRPETQSNRTMMHLWLSRIRSAKIYRGSQFYLSNLILMIVMLPLCLALLAIVEQQLSLQDQLWLIVQSIFHIGLGDVNIQPDHWPAIFVMISTCFLIYFQCFAFIAPQYPSKRLNTIMKITELK